LKDPTPVSTKSKHFSFKHCQPWGVRIPWHDISLLFKHWEKWETHRIQSLQCMKGRNDHLHFWSLKLSCIFPTCLVNKTISLCNVFIMAVQSKQPLAGSVLPHDLFAQHQQIHNMNAFQLPLQSVLLQMLVELWEGWRMMFSGKYCQMERLVMHSVKCKYFYKPSAYNRACIWEGSREKRSSSYLDRIIPLM